MAAPYGSLSRRFPGTLTVGRGFIDPSRSRAAAGDTRDARTRTVTELTRSVKALLEGNIGRVWVEGEVTNLTRHRSGHLYFTLKDAGAALSCVMWRSAAGHLGFTPEEGAKVLCKGNISVYEPQGRYQLVADSMQPVGAGDDKRRLEELTARLRAEGLFSPERKQPLPAFPQTLGIVTSQTGAAVRDIIRIARRRMPGLRIILSPCAVQGAQAPEEIVRALARLDMSGLCDVIIVGRGGGSAEDLAAFNDERVVRAVFAARTPVVSAVGHEVDTTLTDFAADWRSATPSEAAEQAVPDAEELVAHLGLLARRAGAALRRHAKRGRERLSACAQAPVFRRPERLVQTARQRLDLATEALSRAIGRLPESARRRWELCAARLEAMSPLSVLGRGYSVTRAGTKGVVRNAEAVTMGDRLETRLARGRLVSTVTEIHTEERTD